MGLALDADGTLPNGIVDSDAIKDGTIVNADISSSAAIDFSKIQVNSSSSPPSNPTLGTLWFFPVDSSLQINWLFTYNPSAATYKWEYAGGNPDWSQITTSETTTSATYADLATAGPSVTVTRAGIYLIEIFSHYSCATANGSVAVAAKLGSAAALDADGVRGTAPAIGLVEPLSRKVTQRTLAANDVIKLQYKTSAGTASFFDRAIYVYPIAVI